MKFNDTQGLTLPPRVFPPMGHAAGSGLQGIRQGTSSLPQNSNLTHKLTVATDDSKKRCDC